MYSNFEETRSEGMRGNKPKYNAKEIGAFSAQIIAAEAKKEEDGKRLGERLAMYGYHPEDKINKGAEDRLNAIYDPSIYEAEQDKRAYEKGFKENGGRRLAASIANSRLTKEQIEMIAKNDCHSRVISFKDLLNDIKNNEFYKDAYYSAFQEVMEEFILNNTNSQTRGH